MGLGTAQEVRSNDNLWFGACSPGYKEASDWPWLAAPLATSTRNKPPEKIFSFYEAILLNLARAASETAAVSGSPSWIPAGEERSSLWRNYRKQEFLPNGKNKSIQLPNGG